MFDYNEHQNSKKIAVIQAPNNAFEPVIGSPPYAGADGNGGVPEEEKKEELE